MAKTNLNATFLAEGNSVLQSVGNAAQANSRQLRHLTYSRY